MEGREYKFKITGELEALAGKRLDAALPLLESSLSRSEVQKLNEKGRISVNGRKVPNNTRLRELDEISVFTEEKKETEALAQELPLDIVYEDECLLAVNKEQGMVVHPAAGNPDGTLANALMYHCNGKLSFLNGRDRPGIVHRIDKDTSGLLVAAKTDEAYEKLAAQAKAHSLKREYLCVVHGVIRTEGGTVSAPIGRSRRDRKKMAVTGEAAKDAITHYKVLERFSDYTYIRCILETGRTHQIRVHMAYAGHPVAGDRLYGPRGTPKELKGQCLHAALLGFVHPLSGEYMEFEAPLPEYFEEFLKKLRASENAAAESGRIL